MLKDYFQEIKTGKLGRKRFIILWIMMFVIMIVAMIGVGVSFGVAEHIVGGDLAAAQDKLRGAFAIPAIIIFALVVIAFIFANLNIVAKRARDVGLPGWISSIVITLLSGGGHQVAGSGGGGGIGALLLLILAFIPTNQFRKKSSD